MKVSRHNGLDTKTPFSAKLLLTVVFFLLTAVSAFGILRSSDMSFTLQKWAFAIGFGGLLSALLVAVLYTLLPQQRYRQPRHGAAFYPLCAGALGFVGMALSYIWLGVWPFGEESVMIVDLHHQYGPLLSQLRDMLQNGGNLLYTFKAGIGANFLSLFGYYLASPFNLLLLLFPETMLTEAVLVITLLKNALAAILFAACLQYLLRRREPFVAVLAVCYSLSMYLLAYSWNIMWLDGVMMLPLVVLGFERMMRGGKYGVYILSLAYVLFTNYYIGFMVCLFMVLYYLAFAIRQKRTAGEQGRAFLRFVCGSLIGGGLAMCLLVPVFFALRYTSAAGEPLPEANSTFQLVRLFGRHLFGSSPTIRSGNLPNIYCGILPLFLLPLFFTSRSIPLRRRLAFGGLLGVLTVSFTVNIFNLVWHGLHTPNDLPYRFSFLYVFTLLLIAGMLFPHLHTLRVRQIGGALAGLVGATVLYEGLQQAGSNVFLPVYVSLLLLAVYAVILLLFLCKKAAVRTVYALLSLVVTVELTLNGAVTLDTLNGNEYFTNRNSYVDNAQSLSMQAAVDEMNRLADAEVGNGFYRAEVLPRRTCVDTALYHYRGLTSFSSSNYYHTTRLLGNLGFAHNGVNSYLYNSFVPAVDSLLGLRYLALQNDIGAHRQLEKIGQVGSGEGTYFIYRNRLALPLGFLVSEGIRDFSARKYNPFATQDNLLSAMTGDATPLYSFLPITAQTDSTDGASTYSTQFSIKSGGSPAWFSATVTTAAQYYVFVDCMAAKSATVTTHLADGSEGNTWDASTDEPYIIDAGTLEAGATFEISVSAEDAVSGNLYIAALDTALLEQKLAALAADGLQVTSFREDSIAGTLNASTNGAVFTSIPYDAAWTVKVDGQPVKTYPVGDLSDDGSQGAFLCFDIAAGNHSVTLCYLPTGLKIGVLLSAISAVAFLLLLLIARRRRPPEEPLSVSDDPLPPTKPFSTADSPELLSASVTLGDLLSADPLPTEEKPD